VVINRWNVTVSGLVVPLTYSPGAGVTLEPAACPQPDGMGVVGRGGFALLAFTLGAWLLPLFKSHPPPQAVDNLNRWRKIIELPRLAAAGLPFLAWRRLQDLCRQSSSRHLALSRCNCRWRIYLTPSPRALGWCRSSPPRRSDTSLQ
jgi:hypothetical protein